MVSPERSRDCAKSDPGVAGAHQNSWCTVKGETEEGDMPDKSPRKPSAKKPADRSLKEKRQDKKGKKVTSNPFGA